MSLFGKKTTNVAVIDVRSSSIGAAYVVVPDEGAPTLAFASRFPLDPHATEPVMEALPRTLEATLNQLTRDGAPALRALSGRGSVDRAVVTFTAPWQRSHVGTRTIDTGKPFIFSHETLKESASNVPVTPGFEPMHELVLATLLNGYEVDSPFGKKVNRAELITLSSALDSALMDLVRSTVRKALHIGHIEFNAFMPEAYAVMRDLYPHQRDFLVMDIGSEATDVMLAKHGLLVSMTCMPHGVGEVMRAARASGLSSTRIPAAEVPVLDLSKNQAFANDTDAAKAALLAEMKDSLAVLAKEEPLPRMVFLLAEEHVRDFLKNLLDAPELRTLWLSNDSINVLPLLPAQFAAFLGTKGVTEPDPALAILALSLRKHG